MSLKSRFLHVVAGVAAIVGAGICVNQVLQDSEWNWWALAIGVAVALIAEAVQLWLDHREPPVPQLGDRSVAVAGDLPGIASLGDGGTIAQAGTPQSHQPAPVVPSSNSPRAGARSVSTQTLSGIASLGDNVTITQSVSHHHPPAPLPSPAVVEAPDGLVHVPAQTGEFVGRTSDLERLSLVMDGSGPVVVAAVAGLGGVGKSTLAARYALDQAAAGWSPVWWIAADTPADLQSGLAALAVALQPETTGCELEVLAERAVLWLATHTGWLLILDNVNDPADITYLSSRLSSGRILATSRLNEGWHRLPGHRLLNLDVLAHDEAVDLLTRLAHPTNRQAWPGADELVDELGCLPLAIDQAGAYLHQTRLTPAAYLDLLRDHPAVVLDRTAQGADSERTTARIWRITFDHLVGTTPLAGVLLRILAWWAPDDIARSLLDGLADPVDVAEAVGALAAYNMIALTEETITVHRLVQSIARTPDPDNPHRQPDDIDTARQAASELLWVALPYGVSEPASWPTVRGLLPHIDALVGRSKANDDIALQLLLHHTGHFLRGQGMHVQAISYLNRSLAICEHLYGPDHPDTLTARNNLARTHRAAGHFDLAIDLHEQTLASRQRLLGAEHDHTLSSCNNLASAYRAAGYLDLAIDLFERTLSTRERLSGAEHPQTLICRGNLASTYRDAGELDLAIELHEQTHATHQELIGPDHPLTLTSLSNLTLAYQDAGELDLAIDLHTQILTARERLLGPDHPDTLTSRNNLAGAHQEAGDLDLAIELNQQVLTARERVLGPDHPHTATSRNNLAAAHQEAGPAM